MLTSFDDRGGLGERPHLETLSIGDTDHVVIPDAHFLFTADFKRSGDHLILSGEDGQVLVRHYFGSDKRPSLVSPEGAALSADLIEILAGPANPGVYAQAAAPVQAAPSIGKVVAASGNVTAMRNGVAVTLNAGDAVLKGDILQTGSNSALNITLIDNTTFSMTSNARMVVNELVYDANGAGNSALISLVQGSITFLAGQVAKTGDMRVETPVATMGIRGTAVQVNISSTDGSVQFSVMIEPNGQTGSFNIYDKTTGALLATVNNSQIGYIVQPAGLQQVNVVPVFKTPEQLQQELAIVQQLFETQNLGEQILQQQDDSNPQTSGHIGTSGVQTGLLPTVPLSPNPPQINITYPQPPGLPPFSGLPVGDVLLPDAPPAIVPSATVAGGTVSEQSGQTGSNSPHVVTGGITFSDGPNNQHTAVATFVSAVWTRANGTTALISDRGGLTLGALAPGAHSVDWTYTVNDAALDFLADAETLTVTYKVTIADNFGQQTIQFITVTIDGANDGPVITGATASATIDLVANPPQSQSASGAIDFTDIDATDAHVATASFQGEGSPLGTLTVTLAQDTTGSGSGGRVEWTYTIDPDDVAAIPLGESRTESFLITIDDGHGGTVQQVLTIELDQLNQAPIIHAPAQLNYWAAATTGAVTAINNIAFADRDAGSDPVSATLSVDFGSFVAPDIPGDGVTVSMGPNGTLALVGSIADINAYIAGNNILFDPLGASLADCIVTVAIDDLGANGGGGARQTTQQVTLHSVSFAFGNQGEFIPLHHTNLYGISTVSLAGGQDVVYTSWNHLNVNATIYDLGPGPGSDQVILTFSPSQIEEILSTTALRSELQNYLDGNQINASLNLSASSWNAGVTGAEVAFLVLATGNSIAPYYAMLNDLPDYMSGLSGNSADNTLVGAAAGETISGAGGDDILVGLAGNDALVGGADSDILLGGAGNDALNGGSGDDLLWGGDGRDAFQFTANFGQDIVLDFQIGEDVVEFDQSVFSDFADVLANAVEVSGSTEISDGLGNKLVLMNVSPASLHPSDFHFV